MKQAPTTLPDAVLKHDGRRVAFDVARFERSLMRAALDADSMLSPLLATRLAGHIATTVSAAAVEAGMRVVATADIRALVLKSLRDANYRATADAYQNHARETAVLLWRVRVCAPETRP